ncbi:MAG: hypothetical protein NQ127_01060 [Candidatus Cardinium sp.]|nr:hypothetical protein [Candidatus Cardinium sp.]
MMASLYPNISLLMVIIAFLLLALAVGIYFHKKTITLREYCTTSVLRFYSSFGGIRSVTFTDVLQLITFTLIIPFLAILMIQKIDKPFADTIPFYRVKHNFN